MLLRNIHENGCSKPGFGFLGEFSFVDDATSGVRPKLKKAQGFSQAAVQGIAREGQGRLARAAQDVIQGQQGARLNSTTMTSSALVSTELRGRLHITTAFATVTYSLLICRTARAGAP